MPALDLDSLPPTLLSVAAWEDAAERAPGGRSRFSLPGRANSALLRRRIQRACAQRLAELSETELADLLRQDSDPEGDGPLPEAWEAESRAVLVAEARRLATAEDADVRTLRLLASLILPAGQIVARPTYGSVALPIDDLRAAGIPCAWGRMPELPPTRLGDTWCAPVVWELRRSRTGPTYWLAVAGDRALDAATTLVRRAEERRAVRAADPEAAGYSIQIAA